MQESSNTENNSGSFSELISDKALLSKLVELGIETPTELQKNALPALLEGKSIHSEADQEAGTTTLCGIAISAIDLSGKKALFSTRPNGFRAAAEQLQNLGVAVCALDETGTPVADSNFASLKDASTIAGTPKALAAALAAGNIAAEDFSLVIFQALDVPTSAPESDRINSTDVNAILDAFGEATPQRIWIAQSIPLAFVGQVKRFFFTEDAQAISGAGSVSGEGAGGGDLQHIYYEVGNELTAKPQALCDIIEAQPNATAAIFCNSPSDADLVEVFLKRRGISTEKLIGHVPPRKVQDALERTKVGEVTAIVITDVAARNLRVDDLDMIINHSVHAEPEVYIDRVGGLEGGGKLSQVISIVGATDIGNFHYLKKLVDYSFEKRELPSAADMLEVKFSKLLESTQSAGIGLDSQYEELTAKILEHGNVKSIIAYLLHSTLELLPDAQSKGKKRGKRSRDRDYDRDDSRQNDRGRGRGRDRDERSGRGRDGDRDRERREPKLPPKRDIRIYVGHGVNHGFSEERFNEILKTSAGDEELPAPKRVSVREHYTFVDFAEESAQGVLDKLEGAEYEDGEKLIAYKAASINVPREEVAKEADENAGSEESAAEAAPTEEATPAPEVEAPASA